MKLETLPLVAAILTAASVSADDRTLFDFGADDAAKSWQTLNDGVMGGRSIGRFKINEEKKMEFFGTLSLENNGGFASVRTRPTKLDLREGDAVVLRVRGDGRQYSLNLYVPSPLVAFSYRVSFQTKKDQWIEVRLPLKDFVATSFGRVVRDSPLDPAKVNRIGILLGDKKAGPFTLQIDWIKVGKSRGERLTVPCEGTYRHHLQGICTDEHAIYWSFTTTLVKTDMTGKLLKKVPVANHHGDLCLRDGKLYVAVNLGKFNDPKGNADSWVFVYDTDTLKELARRETQQVFHGAGGIGHRNGHFFVVGGLPAGVQENYVYEYDEALDFVKKHVVNSGHTHLGIQTATFAHDRWWFGCYGDPKILLVTDVDFRMKGRYELDGSLGIDGMSAGRLLIGSGRCEANTGCSGHVRTAFPNEQAGYELDRKEEKSK